MNTKANPLTKEIDLKKNANTNLIYKKHNTQHDHPHHTTPPREKKTILPELKTIHFTILLINFIAKLRLSHFNLKAICSYN